MLADTLQHLNQHIFLSIHFQTQQIVLSHLLEHIREALEADGAFGKIRLCSLNIRLEDGRIDALEAVVLIVLELLGESGTPVLGG